MNKRPRWLQITLAWCEILKAKTQRQQGKQSLWGSKIQARLILLGSRSSSDCRQKVIFKGIFICYISSESECLPTNKWFQVLPTMSSEMPWFQLPYYLMCVPPLFPLRCVKVYLLRKQCRITTVNGKEKHKCAQQGLMSCCVTMKHCSALK